MGILEDACTVSRVLTASRSEVRDRRTSAHSGGAPVFVDQAAEAISALYRTIDRDGLVGRWPGSALVDALVGAGTVVVIDELREDILQVPVAENQQVVEQLSACCATNRSAIEFARGAR